MKSFRYFTEYVNASVPYFSLGGTSTGPGMGQYVPVADLNAQKKKRPKLRRTKQDPDIKDSPGTEPAKYYAKDAAGKKMAKSTKQARHRHFTKGAAKDDDDPSAYKPAPGDKGAKTKPSKHTLKYKKMFGEEPRIPRKKGQPAGSDKHSDLYTDENPKGTIHGLGFKDVATAKASVSKIEKSNRTHAHKIQAAIAMEQRARVMGKTAEAIIYRAYIEKMKKKTKEMRKENIIQTAKKRLKQAKIDRSPIKKGPHAGSSAFHQNVRDKQDRRVKKEVSEALKLKLSNPKNNPDMMVLKVRDTNQRGHVEVRGKKGYETKHNKRDKLHQFLDQLDGPTVSTLLGTEDEITLNPKNPDRKQTIKVVNDLIQKNEDGHTQKYRKVYGEDAEDDELARDMAAAQRKMQGAREKKRLKVRHKTQMDRLKTATPDEKKALKTRQDAESKANAIAIKRDIENIRRTEGLWDNIRKKRERIKRGSGERMRKPGDKGAPTPSQIQRAKGD